MAAAPPAPPPPPPPPPILKVEGLSRAFGGHRAVDDVSFRLARGSITGLIGPNGAGKSTLFDLLAGRLRPDAGRVALDGARLDGLRPERVAARGLARTFQVPRPFGALTVLENAALGARGHAGERLLMNALRPGRVASDEARALDAARHWLAFVGLWAHRDAPARSLSGGQRKLLDLARAMVSAPALLLMDEPGAGVAPPLKAAIAERVREINAREGLTVLLVEHDLDLVMSLCDPVLVMARGRLLAEGPPDAVRRDPRVVEAYLGGHVEADAAA